MWYQIKDEDAQMFEETNYFKFIDIDSSHTPWKIMSDQGRKVDAIKDFRARHGCGLKEAKDVVDEYERRRPREVRVVTLGGGNEIHITKVSARMFSVKTVNVLGAFDEDELLQVVANAAREGMTFPARA